METEELIKKIKATDWDAPIMNMVDMQKDYHRIIFCILAALRGMEVSQIEKV